MYQEFYGLKEKPFEVTPDTTFLYLTPAYNELLSALLYGIHERRGFIAVVGEVGTGKTIILNAMLDRLDSNVRSAFIYNSDLTANQMLSMILFELGVIKSGENLSKVMAIQKLHDFALDVYKKGGNIVIIIDEAQHLNHKTMENLRMLSNLETKKSKLVQFVLAGQPELDKKLALPEWRQLVQRISLKRYSTEFDESNTIMYIEHRLQKAGKKNGTIFTSEALKLIYDYSNGVPRTINILCDNAMLIGFGLNQKIIDEDIVKEVIGDMSLNRYVDSKTEEIEENGRRNKKETSVELSSILATLPESKEEAVENDQLTAAKVRTVKVNENRNAGKNNFFFGRRNWWISAMIFVMIFILLSVFY